MSKTVAPFSEFTPGIYIAYGANLPHDGLNPLQALHRVVKRLCQSGIKVTQISSLWRSQAWPNSEYPPYHNAVFAVTTTLEAGFLLKRLHELEGEAGRVRGAESNAPRVLDLDLIAYGDMVGEGDLVLPHPRAHERGFVMGPLAEIAPDWRHPVLGVTARELFTRVTVGVDAYPAEDASGLLIDQSDVRKSVSGFPPQHRD